MKRCPCRGEWMIERFRKFQWMITKYLAPFVLSCQYSCWHKFFIVKLLFQSFNEIMSFSFNRVYNQALFIFLREFSYKNSRIHLWSLAWSHRRNSSLVLKSISLLEFWKIDLVFWFQKIIWCLFINDIFNILLVEWQVNQATPSLRWLNYKPKEKKRKKWINTLTLWLSNHVFLNVWIMVCSTLVAHDLWNSSLQRPNYHIGWGQSLLILTACAWNEERPSLLFLSRSEISTSLAIPFWAWIIFLSWKNPD